jgi:hypothetical protein
MPIGRKAATTTATLPTTRPTATSWTTMGPTIFAGTWFGYGGHLTAVDRANL